MARRKKKKTSFSKSLKYEIYGIIWLTLSAISLAGEATVGRSLAKMFGLLLGQYYFVIPLVGAVVGLYVMIHRKWPRGWSARRSGLLIIVIALTLASTIFTIENKLPPTVDITSSRILDQVHKDMRTELLQPNTPDGSLYQKRISGGYIGAFSYAALFWLFGALGAKLIMVVLFFIGIMLATNMSYVDLIRWLRKQMMQFSQLLRRKLRAERRKKPVKKAKVSAKDKKAALRDLDEADEEDDLDDDAFVEEGLPKRKTMPLFFQLFGGKTGPTGREEPMEENADDSDKSIIIASTPKFARHDEEHEAEVLPLTAHVQPTSAGPIFRDFNEGNASQEDEELDAIYDEEQHWHAGANAGALPSRAQAGHALNEGDQPIPMDADIHETDAPLPLDGNSDERVLEESSAELVEGEPVIVTPPPKPYVLPNFRLLSKPQGSGKNGDQPDFMQTARKLEATLESFGVRAKVLEVVRGPAVTRYEIQPDIGVKVSRIVSLTDDIALALAAKDIRMEAPIPGKSAIGIEVPNSEVSIVTMREVMETQVFTDAGSKLTIAFGRDISGQTIIGNLARMPHLLVAGATGSGKSVCINGIITSVLYKAKPDEVKFLMIDPKMVELNVYNGIPHLLAPVVTDPKRASLALKKIVVEMEKRYELFSKSGTRNIEGYNKLMESNPAAVLPFIVVIVDELADLMMVASNDVEDAICRLAQMARAAGIHLIIATQRPSVDVITGVIKANIPSRIAFGVSSQVDSRTILDMVGAEKLLGRGDMLFLPMGSSKPLRVQGAFLSDEEVEAVVDYCRNQGQAVYNDELVPEVEEAGDQPNEILDELYDQAIQIVLEAKQASVSLLQRRMRIGYTRAARLIDSMESHGIVGPYEGSKPREVLITLEQYQNNNRMSS